MMQWVQLIIILLSIFLFYLLRHFHLLQGYLYLLAISFYMNMLHSAEIMRSGFCLLFYLYHPS
jgi:hypothetical protein